MARYQLCIIIIIIIIIYFTKKYTLKLSVVVA